jgi:hypothetical protein
MQFRVPNLRPTLELGYAILIIGFAELLAIDFINVTQEVLDASKTHHSLYNDEMITIREVTYDTLCGRLNGPRSYGVCFTSKEDPISLEILISTLHCVPI